MESILHHCRFQFPKLGGGLPFLRSGGGGPSQGGRGGTGRRVITIRYSGSLNTKPLKETY